jgi:hypothetical protein
VPPAEYLEKALKAYLDKHENSHDVRRWGIQQEISAGLAKRIMWTARAECY